MRTSTVTCLLCDRRAIAWRKLTALSPDAVTIVLTISPDPLPEPPDRPTLDYALCLEHLRDLPRSLAQVVARIDAAARQETRQ